MSDRWREVAELVQGIVLLLTVGVVLPLLFFDYLGAILGPIRPYLLT